MWRKSDCPTVDMAMAEPAPANHFRQKPAILKNLKSPHTPVAEIVGGKTAECAAILCCCPCGLANLFLLAAVRLPAGLCRQALRKRILVRRTKKREAEFLGSGSDGGSGSGSSKARSSSDDDFPEFTGMRGSVMMVFGDQWPGRSPTAEVMELEKEMSKFYCSGFWRSLSQKDAH